MNTVNSISKQNDPENPWGPNYQYYPLYWKIYTKFISMSSYVSFSEEDKERLEKANLIYYYSLLGIGLGVRLSFELYARYKLRSFPRYR